MLRTTRLLAAGALAATALLAHADECRYVPVATVPLLGTGPVRQPMVQGTINENPVVMLFDTGAYTTLLRLHAAERLKVPLDPTNKLLHGAAGATRQYQASIRDLAIGDAHSGRATLPVIGKTGLPENFDAIVGADFAMQMDLELNFAEHKLRFFRASDCADRGLSYWDKDAMEVAFTGDSQDNTPGIAVKVNGHPLRAIIDTGAVRTTIQRAAAERIGLHVDSPDVLPGGRIIGIGNETVASWHTVVDSIEVGTETIKGANLTIKDGPAEAPGRSPELLLGADFLQAHRVLIARSQQRFYISYLGGQVFPPFSNGQSTQGNGGH